MIKQIYDSGADAFYVTIKKGKVARTINAGAYLVDLNKAGEELGYEILNYSKNPISEIKGVRIISPKPRLATVLTVATSRINEVRAAYSSFEIESNSEVPGLVTLIS